MMTAEKEEELVMLRRANTIEWGHLHRTTSTKHRTGFAAYRPSGTRQELEMSEKWVPQMRYEMRRLAAPSPQPTHGT